AAPAPFNRHNHPITKIKRIGTRHLCWPPSPSQHLESQIAAQRNPLRFRFQEMRSNRRYDAALVRAFAASLSYECLEIQILQWPTRVETKPFTHALGAIASMSPITSTTAVRPEVRAFFKAGPM